MKTYSFNNIIYLSDEEIKFEENGAYGIFYVQTRKKLFWKKWSRRCFLLTPNGLSFWKQLPSKRTKFKKLYFCSFFKITGIENNIENNKNYLTFNIFYDKYKPNKKLEFKSSNYDNFPILYNIIDSYANDGQNYLYRD